jgi:hypothetical protein|tara:strand:+ start:5160 stop:5735 length:576 start_codon:yes stop_codon:yes gene_type:complete
MAIDKEEKDLASGLGELIAPSTAGNTQDMLKAIQNAALIRAGIGIMGQRKMGESGYDVASRVLKDVSADATTQIAAVQKLQKDSAATKLAAKKETRAEAKDALSAYDKLYFKYDSVLGMTKQKDGALLTAQIPPPSQELFKNEMYDVFLSDTGLFDALQRSHIKAVDEARKLDQEHTWEDTIAQFNSWAGK